MSKEPFTVSLDTEVIKMLQRKDNASLAVQTLIDEHIGDLVGAERARERRIEFVKQQIRVKMQPFLTDLERGFLPILRKAIEGVKSEVEESVMEAEDSVKPIEKKAKSKGGRPKKR